MLVGLFFFVDIPVESAFVIGSPKQKIVFVCFLVKQCKKIVFEDQPLNK